MKVLSEGDQEEREKDEAVLQFTQTCSSFVLPFVWLQANGIDRGGLFEGQSAPVGDGWQSHCNRGHHKAFLVRLR